MLKPEQSQSLSHGLTKKFWQLYFCRLYKISKGTYYINWPHRHLTRFRTLFSIELLGNKMKSKQMHKKNIVDDRVMCFNEKTGP